MDACSLFARVSVLAALAAAAFAPAAAAQDPAPPPPPPPPEATPTPTPTPEPPPPPPADGRLRVEVDAPHRDRGNRIVLRGDRVTVSGTLQPFVAGQKAIVRVRHGSRRLAARRVSIRPSPDGMRGVFRARLRLRRAGTMAIEAAHRGTPELRAVRATPKRVLVLRPRAGFGARGPLVRLFQRGLRALRYPAPLSGVYDAATGRAVMAWRKVNRRARVETADEAVVRAVLARRGAWTVRHPRAGRHVEADLSLQALALVDGKRVVRVYHTSSGAPATPTIVGRFRFYRKDYGTNALGMVHAAYFIRGYAIHGYRSVPPWNASHGCLRVPIPDALRIFNWIRLGDRIIVER